MLYMHKEMDKIEQTRTQLNPEFGPRSGPIIEQKDLFNDQDYRRNDRQNHRPAKGQLCRRPVPLRPTAQRDRQALCKLLCRERPLCPALAKAQHRGGPVPVWQEAGAKAQALSDLLGEGTAQVEAAKEPKLNQETKEDE